MAHAGQFQFHLHRQALNNVGAALDTPVTLNLKNVPFEMLLRLGLQPFDLTYTLDHGVVMVTTPQEAGCQLKVRVYPVADLLKASVYIPRSPTSGKLGGGMFSVNDQIGQPAASKDRELPSSGAAHPVAVPGMVAPSGPSVFSPDAARAGGLFSPLPKTHPARKSDETLADRQNTLIDLITVVVEPTSWVIVGGPGSICAFGETLVIRQTWQVHWQIETLLADLRQAVAEQKQPQ